jgi:hypothetical protein
MFTLYTLIPGKYTLMYNKDNIFWWVASLVWIILIGILSLLPPSELSGWSFLHIPGMDKVLHALFYVILAIFLSNTMFQELKTSKLKIRIMTILLCLSYGLLIEFLQPLTGRSKSFYDLLADMGGAIVGTLLFYQIRKIKIRWLG